MLLAPFRIRQNCCDSMSVILGNILVLGFVYAGLADRAYAAEVESAISVLIDTMNAQPDTWAGIHAAEALLALDRPGPVLMAYSELAEIDAPALRVGVWRVMAQAVPDTVQQDRCIDRIRAIFLDPLQPDQLHAVEALAKLKVPVTDGTERQLTDAMASAKDGASPFALWRLIDSGDGHAMNRLAALLDHDDAIVRLRTASALSTLNHLTDDVLNRLNTALVNEPDGSPARRYLIAAIGGDALRNLSQSPDPKDRYVALMQMARQGESPDPSMLTTMLSENDADVRIAAAFNLLMKRTVDTIDDGPNLDTDRRTTRDAAGDQSSQGTFSN